MPSPSTTASPLRRVNIVPDGERSGQCLFSWAFVRALALETGAATPAQRDRVERYVIASLAGPLAQRRYAPRSLRRWHGHGDFTNANDVLSRLCGSLAELEPYINWLQVRATEWLTRDVIWPRASRQSRKRCSLAARSEGARFEKSAGPQ